MKALTLLFVAYAAASLLHYAHNAEFLSDYPNMPAWLSRTKVYSTWLALSALGAYAAAGFDSLGHFALAPAAAHTAAMNATIWLEAGTAALLLAAVARLAAKPPGSSSSTA